MRTFFRKSDKSVHTQKNYTQTQVLNQLRVKNYQFEKAKCKFEEKKQEYNINRNCNHNNNNKAM